MAWAATSLLRMACRARPICPLTRLCVSIITSTNAAVSSTKVASRLSLKPNKVG